MNKVREKLRLAVFEKLNSMELIVKARLGKDVNHSYSQIWLNSELLTSKDVQFGLESFSGKGNTGGRMFIGVFCLPINSC